MGLGRRTPCQQTGVGLSRGFEAMGKVGTGIFVPCTPGVRVVGELASPAATWLCKADGGEQRDGILEDEARPRHCG